MYMPTGNKCCIMFDKEGTKAAQKSEHNTGDMVTKCTGILYIEGIPVQLILLKNSLNGKSTNT